MLRSGVFHCKRYSKRGEEAKESSLELRKSSLIGAKEQRNQARRSGIECKTAHSARKSAFTEALECNGHAGPMFHQTTLPLFRLSPGNTYIHRTLYL